MENTVGLKSDDQFVVEYEVVFPESENSDDEKTLIELKLANVEEQLKTKQEQLTKIDSELDRLTNHADGLDYSIAVASGIIAGIIDSVWVGEFSIDRANEWGNDKVNNFVVNIAQKQGYEGNDLPGAIEFLEKKYPIAADKATDAFGGGLQHHLRDFSHHPTPIGLFFSLLTQFTGKVYGTDVTGRFIVVPVEKDGVSLIGKNLPEKITFGVINWFFHMVSDMAGSSGTVANGGVGTGLPGPLVSFLKEISALPIFRNTNSKGYKEFSVWISKLFNGTLLGKRDENGKLVEPVKFDLRTEIGVLHEVGRQAVPVIVNECIVRGFYFIRRLVQEIKNNDVRGIKDLKKIEWEKTLPFKNRTVVRMLTIATGTFTAVDMADAAVRSAIKSGGITPVFISNFLLRVNFVGVGRVVVACATDAGMGMKKSKVRNERIAICNEMIHLTNAKVFYKQANMWIEAKDATETIQQAYELIDETTEIFNKSVQEIQDSIDEIGLQVEKAEERNPGLLDEINDILMWG